MKIIRKIFSTFLSILVDIIGGSILSYLADIGILNKIYYKKIIQKTINKNTKIKNTISDFNLRVFLLILTTFFSYILIKFHLIFFDIFFLNL